MPLFRAEAYRGLLRLGGAERKSLRLTWIANGVSGALRAGIRRRGWKPEMAESRQSTQPVIK
ncbi:MAG: hypothetical protein NZ699_19445 [Roseiflexus sp.]|nr:hypothetical protein [Roseiflexus sp.]MCS7291296.1 hypothetical protein [Roseiflexus sp.]MDW8145519.1 hypothetical protein [Roseiflexaceae bacterium]MDW8231438.1 hypothetical protein [Roseiflexaceae bacterium]